VAADELAAYLDRITSAQDVPTLADLARELAVEHTDDRATASRLLAIVAIRWKRVEAAN
jgi:hypothetical protein